MKTDVRLRLVAVFTVAVFAVAGVLLLGGCGSSAGTSSTPHTTPRATQPSATPTPPARPKPSTRAATKQPPLGWIRRLQRDLKTLHFYAGPLNGVETTETRIAVIRFQRAAQLKPDGLWGTKSQAALDKMLARKP